MMVLKLGGTLEQRCGRINLLIYRKFDACYRIRLASMSYDGGNRQKAYQNNSSKKETTTGSDGFSDVYSLLKISP